MSEITCHPLKPVCLLFNFVGNHLYKRQWVSPTLTEELLPASTKIVYKSAVDGNVREDALPIVAYQLKQLSLVPHQERSLVLNPQPGAAVGKPQAVFEFTVSTTNEGLTNELATEIGIGTFAAHSEFKRLGLFIEGVTISGAALDADRYYISKVAIQASLAAPVWNFAGLTSTLREIGIQAGSM